MEHNLPQMYQHFKGAIYVVVRVAKHHANDTEWAVYRPLGDEATYYVRPFSQFSELKDQKGDDGILSKVPRFRLLTDEESNVIVIANMRRDAEAAVEVAESEEDKMKARLSMALVEKLEERIISSAT